MQNAPEVKDQKIEEINSINIGLAKTGLELAKNVKDEPSYREAVGYGMEIDRRLKWWTDDFMGSIVESAHKTWKAALARRAEIAQPLQEAKFAIARACGAYELEQEEKRRAEERRIQADLLKKQEEAKLKEAIKLEKKGRTEEADALLETPTIAPAVTLPKMERVEGTGSRVNWKFEITDAKLLPHKYLVPDLVMIGQVVRAEKDRANIPGVRVYSETIKTFGGR